MTTVAEQFKIYLEQLSTRKRHPIKPATLARYESYFRAWVGPRLGVMSVAAIENGVMKTFVAHLVKKGLSPSSIAGITQFVKGIVASVQDENGNEMLPRVWNAEFIDAPTVIPAEQNTPTISAEGVAETLSRVGSQYVPFFALLAGSGLRVSEAVGLKVGPSPDSSYWDPEQSKIVIKTQIYLGAEQSPKTPAGVREVDLDPRLNDMILDFVVERGAARAGDWLFTNKYGDGPLPVQTLYSLIRAEKMAPFHAFRRFRITHLDNVGVPRGLAMYWTGHAGKDVHDSYVKTGRNIEARKEWAVKAGLGFNLPNGAETEAEIVAPVEPQYVAV